MAVATIVMVADGTGKVSINLATVKLITIGFRSVNGKPLIPGMNSRILTAEEVTRREAHRQRPTGKKFLEPTPDTSLAQFLDELSARGFGLAEAYTETRGDAAISKFVFAPGIAETSALASTLRALARANNWGVEGYLNPHFVDQQAVTNEHTINFNANGRNQRRACHSLGIDRDGSVVVTKLA